MLRITAILALITIACLAIVPMNGSNTGVEVPDREIIPNDLNWNRVHDSLEADPSRTFDIFISYRVNPGEADVIALERLGVSADYVDDGIDIIASYGVQKDVLDDITALPHVTFVEEQPWLVALLDTGVPDVKARYSDLYDDETVWGNERSYGYTGDNVTIAILDTGVDDQHESLDGKFVAGVDVSNPPLIITTNPDDGNGHGTHCAGIAMGNGGATDNDGDGEPDYMGSAPDALLVDVKISTDLGVSAGTLIAGIDWCIENKDQYSIDILSISFGQIEGDSNGSDATSQKVNEAVEAGLVVVVAAGNDGPNNDGMGGPAAADLAITVGAIDDEESITRDDDIVAPYSNRGPRKDDGDDDHMDELKPEITAPGSNISSCDFSPVGQMGIGYIEKDGTSMACPMISGITALMLEAKPSLTPQQVKDILILTTEAKGEPTFPDISDKWNKDWGFGHVDAYLAVRVAVEGGSSSGGVVDSSIDCFISTPLNGTKIKRTINITGIASIDSGSIDRVEIWLDSNDPIIAMPENDEWTKWYYEFDTKNTTDGDHVIGARAISGARSSMDRWINITVDNSKSDDDDDDGFLGMPPISPFIALPLALLVFDLRRRRN